ncbi:hypothetical protein, partial [Sulfitobacter sp.]|uniref:hypothetical protein n=1 Tax=Sulfitobacter sp. TaxID=1903071 RepID=UPI004059E3BD
NRPKPPQTSQDISCTAASGQSLTRKTLEPYLDRRFLPSQHVVFPQNQPEASLKREHGKA